MSEAVINRKKDRRKEILKRYGLAIGFVSPFVLVFIIFTVIPLIMGFIISLCKYNPYDLESTTFVGFGNYLMLFGNNVLARTFWQALGKTLIFDVVAVPCLIIIPLGLAYLINMKPPGYKIFRAIIIYLVLYQLQLSVFYLVLFSRIVN